MSFAIALSEKLRSIENARSLVEHDPGYWWPSQIGFCDRSAVLQHAGVEAMPMDSLSLRRFYLGEAIHTALQKANPYAVVGHELRVRNEEYKVSGRLDSLSYAEDNILEVQEYKSINSRAFSYQDLPKEAHVDQLSVYLMWPATCPAKWHNKEEQGTLLEMDLGCELCSGSAHEPAGKLPLPKRGRLIYISKDDLRVEEFLVTLTKEREDRVKSKFLHLEELYQQYLKDGTLPPPLPLVEKTVKGTTKLEMAWQTRYCSYAGTGRCCADVKEEEHEPNHQRHDSSPGQVPQGE